MASTSTTKKSTLSFQDPAALKELEIIARFKERDHYGRYKTPVLYDEVKDAEGKLVPVLHIADPYKPETGFSFTTIPTRASRADVEKIIGKVSWMKETCFTIERIAKAYFHKRMLILEGPTSIGKTFTLKVFSRLLEGANFEVPLLTCNEGTEAEALNGSFKPRTKSELDSSALESLLTTKFGTGLAETLESTAKDLEGAPTSIKAKVLESTGASMLKLLHGQQETSAYVFEPGLFEKMYSGHVMPNGSVQVIPGEAGTGSMIIVDELTRAKPRLTNAFFPLRGNGRRLSETIQIPDDDSRVVKRGPNAWLAFTQNPVDGDDHVGVHALDEALTRATDFVSLPELSLESLQQISEDMLRFKRDGVPAVGFGSRPFEFYKFDDLTAQLATALRMFHVEYAKVMDRINKSREQKIKVTLDDMGQFAQELFASQVKNNSRSGVDMVATFTEAINNSYLSRPGASEPKVRAELEKCLAGALKSNLAGSLSKSSGRNITIEESIAELTETYCLPEEHRQQVELKKLKNVAKLAKQNPDLPDAIKTLLGQI